jgi:hypothetical protein
MKAQFCWEYIFRTEFEILELGKKAKNYSIKNLGM